MSEQALISFPIPPPEKQTQRRKRGGKKLVCTTACLCWAPLDCSLLPQLSAAPTHPCRPTPFQAAANFSETQVPLCLRNCQVHKAPSSFLLPWVYHQIQELPCLRSTPMLSSHPDHPALPLPLPSSLLLFSHPLTA